MSMKDFALEYADMGIAVFPVKLKNKTPLTEHGCKDATTDHDQIELWWKQWPKANIGIATGKKSGGLCVIDMDINHDGESDDVDGYQSLTKWEDENGSFPDTWLAITGSGGYHMFLKTSMEVTNHIGVLDGVDIRGEGGYVVAPPSIHHNGTQYEWECDPKETELATADDLLSKLIALDTSPSGENADNAFQLPEVIKNGERNDTLFKFACSCQAKGMPDEAVFASVKAVNDNRCENPLTDKEIKSIVSSALKYEKGGTQKSDLDADSDNFEFIRNSDGKIAQLADNILIALKSDEKIKNSVKYNSLRYGAYVCGELPWDDKNIDRDWVSSDDSNLNIYIEKTYALSSRPKIKEAFDSLMADVEYKFNPVIDMLVDIHDNKWDGKRGHIENLLPDYMGVKKNIYSIECMKLLMIGAISRVYTPGCKFDYMPVLIGRQGIGKSTFFRKLALNDDWYDDNFNTVEGDKACEKLRGIWIAEMAELLAAKRAKEVESIKAFITSTVDNYREPYKTRTEQRPRMCVFVGTTNTEQFLTDRTGNRRFLPLTARESYIKKSLFDNDQSVVEQDFYNAWGEALDIYLHDPDGKKLTLSKKAEEMAFQAQTDSTEEDVRVGKIQAWLDSHEKVDRVCAGMLYEEALENEGKTPKRLESNEIILIMTNEIKGWQKMPKKEKCGKYGTTTCFERIEKVANFKLNEEGFMSIPYDVGELFDGETGC